MASVTPISARLEHYVDKRGPDECWPWTGHLDRWGYGEVTILTPRGWRPVKAHRLVFEQANGPLPPGQVVHHTCEDRYEHGDPTYKRCCNLAHLAAVSQGENVRLARANGRNRCAGDQHWTRTHPERIARGERTGVYTHPEKRARGERNGMNTHPERRLQGENHWSHQKPERLARGERNSKAKLTAETVVQIRALATEGYTYSALARQFGVTHRAIRCVVLRESWAHIP